MNKGTVGYPDDILFLGDITLRDGAFFVTASGPGPAPEHHGPMRLYGPGGVLVQDGGSFDVPAADSGQRIRAEVTLTPESPVALP